MARRNGSRVCLVLDDKGRRKETRTSCTDLTLERCPDGATFVLGGTRGCEPYSANMIATFLREAGSRDVRRAASGPRQQHASQIVAHLMCMGDGGDLRNACAMAFYDDQEGAGRNQTSTTIVGASGGPILRDARAITISPRREPSAAIVKFTNPLTKAYLGLSFLRHMRSGAQQRRGPP